MINLKIYLDYIFFENLIVNYILFTQINIFTKSNCRNINKVVATIVISIYTTITYVFEDALINNIFVKIMIVSVGVYIAYVPKSIKEYLKKQLYYYLISFMYVGIIISVTLLFNISIEKLYVKVGIYIVSGLILYVFNKFLWIMWKSNIKSDDLTYTISIKGQEIRSFC